MSPDHDPIRKALMTALASLERSRGGVEAWGRHGRGKRIKADIEVIRPERIGMASLKATWRRRVMYVEDEKDRPGSDLDAARPEKGVGYGRGIGGLAAVGEFAIDGFRTADDGGHRGPCKGRYP